MCENLNYSFTILNVYVVTMLMPMLGLRHISNFSSVVHYYNGLPRFCSAKMMWHGPNQRYNKPEARKFTLIVKNSSENCFLRETGIVCLANHEIGTHYVTFVF